MNKKQNWFYAVAIVALVVVMLSPCPVMAQTRTKWINGPDDQGNMVYFDVSTGTTNITFGASGVTLARIVSLVVSGLLTGDTVRVNNLFTHNLTAVTNVTAATITGTTSITGATARAAAFYSGASTCEGTMTALLVTGTTVRANTATLGDVTLGLSKTLTVNGVNRGFSGIVTNICGTNAAEAASFGGTNLFYYYEGVLTNVIRTGTMP